MVKSIDLSLREFNDMLKDFESRVYAGDYKKMPYNMWRDLKKTEDADEVILEWNPDYIEIFKGRQVQHLMFGEGSFADYVADFYLEDWDRWNDPYGYWEDEYGNHHTLKEVRTTISDYEAAKHIIKADYGSCEPILLAGGPLMSFSDKCADVSVHMDTKADVAHVNYIEERVAALETKINNNNENKKENSIMKGFNFDFGPVNPAAVRMSMHGLAVKNKAGTYVSYDAKNDEIVDVDILNFDGAKYIWKMPVAIKDIAVGDTIVHQNVPMFVVGISEDKKALFAVDPVVGERKEIMLTRSPFGFHFATKVVNMLGGMFNGTASAENPFGNMWMLMAMSDENKDMKEILPFIAMANGGLNHMNPMMFCCLMGKENVDPMLMAMMMGAFNPAPAHECNCGGNCGNHN